MRNYILKRILKSIVSIFAVVSIIIVMIYTMIPSEKVFDNDAGAKKMKGDQLTTYKLKKLEELGYHDYVSKIDMCTATFGDGAQSCIDGDEAKLKEASDAFAAKGYEILTLKSGEPYALHTFKWYELIARFYKRLLVIDNKNAIQDSEDPDMERKYYWGKNPENGKEWIIDEEAAEIVRKIFSLPNILPWSNI